MRAEPPLPPRRRHQQPEPERARPLVHHRRCPYLEQILKDRVGPFHMLTRYKADCHVDHRSRRKYALSDSPPICVRNFEDCPLYQAEKRREDHTITRYTD